jgi:DNA polymerase III delta prime subunit
MLETCLRGCITKKIMESDEYKEMFKNIFMYDSSTSAEIDNTNSFEINDAEINIKLRQISFQDMDSVKRILKKVFGIYINKNEIIVNAVKKRNDIVHRNGIDEYGNEYLVEKKELLQLIDAIRNFTNLLDEKFDEIETNKIFNKEKA